MGEDREKAVPGGPDDILVEDVEGHAVQVEGLIAEPEAVAIEDEDVEGHSLKSE